jgi:hypothetical protein
VFAASLTLIKYRTGGRGKFHDLGGIAHSIILLRSEMTAPLLAA